VVAAFVASIVRNRGSLLYHSAPARGKRSIPPGIFIPCLRRLQVISRFHAHWIYKATIGPGAKGTPRHVGKSSWFEDAQPQPCRTVSADRITR